MESSVFACLHTREPSVAQQLDSEFESLHRSSERGRRLVMSGETLRKRSRKLKPSTTCEEGQHVEEHELCVEDLGTRGSRRRARRNKKKKSLGKKTRHCFRPGASGAVAHSRASPRGRHHFFPRLEKPREGSLESLSPSYHPHAGQKLFHLDESKTLISFPLSVSRFFKLALPLRPFPASVRRC